MRESDSKGLGEKWMISSRMRVSQVAHYSPNMAAFSDAIFTVLIPFTWSSSYEYILNMIITKRRWWYVEE